ncbi:DNA replication ATP-dependent helicase/nuclease DNA2 [Tolypocladium ophioglossoides CBS 100239]|uniref:DNA replication ATP-dependent helicase/nuclease n=1 Tax=Tolypocladium ophioglossoides (strain CBS 100239) TaxID=1163406 RepID=A0A0L0N2Y7_TOLOC|nr:DNA replication ATP-dependent helicase/nuclease DNA2 [Tolypocladium ophioglossoides CBS 100239]
MPLQKSYSERVGLTKNRQPWQRWHSHPANLQTPKPKSLLPISEVTKSKLNKFQYQLRQDADTSDDGPAGEGPGSPSKRSHGDSTVTPPTRLDWRDLVESSAPIEEETDMSPNDKIMWNNKQDSLYASALSPMLARKRKRARSSSPTSSPLADKPNSPTVNVAKLTKALQSPHADPTLELWDRYSLNGPENAISPAGAVNPTLAQLMMSSSPKTSKDASARRGDSNLRRAVSCGLNWPKRRNVERSKLGSQGSGEKRDLEAASKSSLVTALLDTVTSSFNDEYPDDTRDQDTDSPSPKKRPLCPTSTRSPCRAAGGDVDPPASDYGDDDFDDDTFMELEANMNDVNPGNAPTALNPGTPRQEPSETKKQQPMTTDEFEDLDDGIFDDEEGLPNNLQPVASKNIPPATTPKAQRTKSVVQGSPGDEFGGDFDGDIDFDAVELAATQSVQQLDAPPGTTNQKPKTIQRYLVTSVLEGDYIDQCGIMRPEKILIIQADNTKIVRTVHLRGAWFDTLAHAESYVHVIGNFSAKGQCIVDDAQNLLILHPDQLISSTVVADSFGCMRRAVLQDRASPPLVYGTILHEIFQEALLANQWDLPFLARVIERTTEKHVEELYTIKVGMATAREHLQSKMIELSYWAKAFVSSQPKADAIVEDRNGKTANMAITKLLDVEEHVWSPMYGLKGNIDATVEVSMMDGKQQRTLAVPFEVKTGKHANSSHMAQTALYTLLLSDRYDIDIACGVLYYMETSKTMRIPAIRHELRHMILQRNQLACYVRERSVQLPPMLRSEHMCGKCYAKTSCFIYHRLADDGDGESSGMNEKFDELVKHLTPTHQEFFIKWENLLTIEEKESQKTKRELWTMTSHEREKKSRCFADVIIEEGSMSVDTDNPRINRFLYAFVKRVHKPGFSFLESELSVGEPIVVSDEDGHFALAIGYVTAVRKQRISVAVDRRLHNARIRQPGFDEADNQVFASIMEVTPEGASADQTQDRAKQPPVRYRLDQDEFSNGMATVRNNLVQMMANEAPAAAQIRGLIVDLAPPRFKSVPTQYTIADRESLNVDQKRAIEKVMSARDYALVLGMPGTGKTTTIAHIIRALVSQGKSVLLTSHTHTAVDNILLKLKLDKIPILRLGAPAKVHPEVRDFAHLAGQPKMTFEAIKEAWHGTPIVATTCLGINHPVFLERSFDYCIVDEASQITLPICAGPIRMANSFVLVGDHNQLPPVVRNEEAREGGLDVSLFKLLSDAHPESVVNLEHQYRMCEDIMTLSNTLIYQGKLRCGTEALRKKKLHVPTMSALSHVHYDASSLMLRGTPRSFCTGPAPTRCWLYDLLDSEARVRFINTDTIRPMVREEAHGKRIVNSAEVRIVSQLVESLLTVGVPASEVGVMTHYRAQLFLLKDKLKACTGVEMHTTDRFQGRDKEVIVLSLVRSNEACNIGDLLKDWRRINVAFTRAKTKLLVVGSMKTLKYSGKENMLSRFIALMEERDWIYNLPGDALESHHFEELSTPLTTAGATQKAKSPRRSPKKTVFSQQGKENRRPTPKKARVGERVLLKDKLITRDILNEMTNGAY